MAETIASILIVDDNDADTYLSKRTIRRSGLCDRVWTCQDGEDALRFFAEHEGRTDEDGFPPTVILLDINMPRMGGFEFLAAWEHPKNARPVVVVMLTSSRSVSDKARGEALGADLFEEKPLSKEGLQRIEQLVATRGLGA